MAKGTVALGRVKDFNLILQEHGSVERAWWAKALRPGLYINLPSLEACPRFSVPKKKGIEDVLYFPGKKQQLFHASTKPNCLLEGNRGGGKSTALRHGAHMRAVAIPGIRYLILRRTMTELKRSHLNFIHNEMERLGGSFNSTDSIAKYPNGSTGVYGYCDDKKDIQRYLSAEYDEICFDEITTFEWETITTVAACLRSANEGVAFPVLRGGTNPIGLGANDIKRRFLLKDITPDEDREYIPDDYESIRIMMEDNPFIDRKDYEKRLQSLPAHIRKAYLDGIWLNEGAYFMDFEPTRDGVGWHIIPHLPVLEHGGERFSLLGQSWINVYRAIDWGYKPDPAVCLWVAVLPDGQEIVFKEKSWKETLVADIAADIIRLSSGMRVVETFGDPSMFMKHGESTYSVGEQFELNGIQVTKSIDDRALYGYSIHDHLNTLIPVGEGKFRPKLQILAPDVTYKNPPLGCPDLIRTLPDARTDDKDPKKVANGEDHWIVALAYYCTGGALPSQDPQKSQTPRWRLPKAQFWRSFRARYGALNA